MRRGFALGCALALFAGLAAACGDDDSSGSANGVRVVATTTVTADFVKQIGGDRVSLYSAQRPNVDPHDFEPSPKDINAFRDAAVIIHNGVGLEAWFDDAIRSSGAKAQLVDASEGITIRAGHGDGDEHESGDPHIWNDPRNAMKMVATIAHALSAADPAGAATYEANLASYTAELQKLDAEIAGQLSALSNKKLVTNHDAFGYYVDRYGLELVGTIIPSFDTSAELSATDIADLVAAIKTEGVKAVFSESSLPPKTAEAIAKEAGVKVVEGEDALYGDGLGPKGSGSATYLEMMRHNTQTIVTNLR
jgi:zinc/manganese transport system substrate-binding protein/manganese/iron transport system substrate-binding protein